MRCLKPGPYTGFDDGGGGKAQFSTTGGQGPQISKFPQNHKGPPLCENRDLRFRGGGMAPCPPLYTGLLEADTYWPPAGLVCVSVS